MDGVDKTKALKTLSNWQLTPLDRFAFGPVETGFDVDLEGYG
jgi:hypothetical protein